MVSDEMASARQAKKTESSKGALELSEDEVFSRFSEQTESISSFTSTNEAAATTGENSNDTTVTDEHSNHAKKRQRKWKWLQWRWRWKKQSKRINCRNIKQVKE